MGGCDEEGEEEGLGSNLDIGDLEGGCFDDEATGWGVEVLELPVEPDGEPPGEQVCEAACLCVGQNWCLHDTQVIGTTNTFVQPLLKHISPFSFRLFNSAFFLSSPPSNATHVPPIICRSTASFGSFDLGVGTTSWHNGQVGAILSTIEGGRGAVHECWEGRKWG